MTRPRFLPDNFTLVLIAVVTLASILPAQGLVAQGFELLTTAAIALLFFLHGARLSRAAVVAGLSHWRLHLLVLGCTFVLFPLLGLGLKPLFSAMLTPDLALGMLFLCALPATVQSAIAFTAMARGNVAAAVCSASASSLIGVFITPLLVSLIVVAGGVSTANPWDAVGRIMLQLMLPFVAGQLLQPWVGDTVKRHAAGLKFVDQGSILLVVYTAFSAAVVEGLWKQVPPVVLIGLVAACCLLLALALALTTWGSRWLGFSKEDEVTIVFCGSKKSLASGVPMAKVLFAAHTVGVMLLPLMIFHQIQLMVCAVLAQRYAKRAP
ncbi:sodium/bile acid cotransporter 7 [Rhodoferax ferrireducens]|uniref:Sodium/bile acid cotransporter 7 n=1 Tax=Rhodoferax ferrireducens TaxID=192843 RepID=A0ABU2C7I3_9BURK|nr:MULTISPECIES: bile acid:sodium symporter family protein [Rhodoferax]MDR7377304.1 sodium/bile acid cotransporter 7 [Rhodoferax ferrireducens]SDO41224.1 solute carrier family 10 (sodium/bile acid cotransporter), member 7 [Rhodoferax sp. OV413]